MPPIQDHFRLDGQRAIITGGASGIGGAIATAFAAAGAIVTILDLDPERSAAAARGLGPTATGLACDVADETSVAHAFAHISSHGGCDILVNSAGIAHIGPIATCDPSDFDRLFRVNVRGTYLCMRAAIAGMTAVPTDAELPARGVILNLASIAATTGLPDRFAYSMTKGAVLAMTLSVARDYVAHNIRCNCISPARVHTPFVDGFLARTYPGRESEMMQQLAQSQPIGRMGTPEEIALLALYLCSPASAFVTGTDYPIDGGFLNLR